MTAAIALTLLAQGPLPPMLPAGATPAFAQAALAVEARLAAGDVPGAREAARALPERTPTLRWTDDDKLPAPLRQARAALLDKAVGGWSRAARGFAPKVVGTDGAADLTIGFAPSLAEDAEGLPAPIQIEPGLPLRAKIGLTRGKPGEAVTDATVTMEIAYALGRYLGVSDSPFPVSAMHQDPHPSSGAYSPQLIDSQIAAKNLDLADRLRAAIEAGKPLGLAAPKLELPLTAVDLGETAQGTMLHGALRLENKGSGPLSYQLIRDCGCFRIPVGPYVPGEKGYTANFEVDTREYIGRVDKTLLLLTNDPERPSIQIPVTFRARPAYRLFHPGGDRVAVPDAGGTYDIFLFVPPGSDIVPTDARWDGVDAKLTWDEWQGPLADPDMQEGTLFRKGWRFRVRIPATLPPGHLSPGTLTIATESPKFATLATTLIAQRGIVADPESLYMGTLKPGSQTSLLIRRPKTPFKILSVDAGVLKAKWFDIGDGTTYRVDLTYTGGAQKGDFLVPIRVRTDDPKRPLVEGVVTGIVQ